MLAGLSVMWARCRVGLATGRCRLRKLLPPNGRAYELVDSALLLLAVGLFAYVLADPPAATTTALRAPLAFFTETQVGWLVAGAGIVGAVCAYVAHPILRAPDRIHDAVMHVGYGAVMLAPLLLSAWFAIGAVTTDAGTRPIGQAVLYGYVFRQAWRANRREHDAPHRCA